MLKELLDFLSTVSIFINIYFLILIIFYSPKKLGTYKYLMMYFSINSIIFSTLEIIVRPVLISHDAGFIVFSNRKDSSFNRTFDYFLLSTVCGICGTTITITAIQFIFRYFAIERKGRLDYFKKQYLWFWFLIPLMSGVGWIGLCHFLGEDERTTELFRADVFKYYNFEMEDVIYVGAYYFYNNRPNWSNITTMLILQTILIISLLTIIILCLKIHSKIKQLRENEGESEYSKKLQKQFYKALVFQTILPIFLMLVPLNLFFFLPITGIDVTYYSQIANFTCVIYPALDPLPNILIIDEYRKAFLSHFLFWRKNRIEPANLTNLDTNNK